MELAKVTGQVVSTVRDPRLPHCSLLVVDLIGSAGVQTGVSHVAADPIGAGVGEWVLLTRGSAARLGLGEDAPVDLCVVGIVDEVTDDGRHIFKNGRKA